MATTCTAALVRIWIAMLVVLWRLRLLLLLLVGVIEGLSIDDRSRRSHLALLLLVVRLLMRWLRQRRG